MKQLAIVTKTIIKKVPMHLFSPFTSNLKEWGVKSKWTNKLPGKLQNHDQQAFLNSKVCKECGPHILYTQLHPASALLIFFLNTNIRKNLGGNNLYFYLVCSKKNLLKIYKAIFFVPKTNMWASLWNYWINCKMYKRHLIKLSTQREHFFKIGQIAFRY